MQIQYLNLDKRLIDKQEAKGDYFIQYFSNSLIKREEEVSNDQIVSIRYYKDASETDEQIIEMFSNSPLVEVIYIRTREPYLSYRIENELEYERYNGFQLSTYRFKFLYNSNNDLIAEEGTETSLPIDDPEHRNIRKYYYFKENDEPYAYFVTRFTGSGSFDIMEYNPTIDEYEDIELYDLQEALTFMTKLGLRIDLRNWYVNSQFLPPV